MEELFMIVHAVIQARASCCQMRCGRAGCRCRRCTTSTSQASDILLNGALRDRLHGHNPRALPRVRISSTAALTCGLMLDAPHASPTFGQLRPCPVEEEEDEEVTTKKISMTGRVLMYYF